MVQIIIIKIKRKKKKNHQIQIHINYLCDKKEPCNPQRRITALEATLESTPHALIQMIYLVKTDTFSSNILVSISLLTSLWSIT